MNILVTGAGGFIGKNFIYALKNMGCQNIFEFHSNGSQEELKQYCGVCDFVFHLAGVNRSREEADFKKGNVDFTQNLVDYLSDGSCCPVVFSSSIHAGQKSPYGQSKQDAEDILRNYSKRVGAPVYIFRLPNVFGKWSRPNYNSVIATFCFNIANGLPIYVTDENRQLKLVYIDDVVQEFARVLDREGNNQMEYCTISEVYTRSLGDIERTLREFAQCTADLSVPDQSDAFTKKLYSTYLSYVPPEKLRYQLPTRSDTRGSFSEFIRTEDRGQVSINVTKQHEKKGNHWHQSKHEIFLTVSGKGVIRLRKVGENETIEIPVDGIRLEPVLIPPGYAHVLENVSEEDLITVIWANESFNPNRPDTFYLEV